MRSGARSLTTTACSVGPGRRNASTSASPVRACCALRIMDALLTAAEARGFKVTVADGEKSDTSSSFTARKWRSRPEGRGNGGKKWPPRAEVDTGQKHTGP